MDLISTLRGLDEFTYVATLESLLTEIGVRNAGAENQSFAQFLQSTVVLLEKDKQKNKTEFFAALRRERVSNSDHNIQNFIKSHLNQLHGEAVESKGLENSNSQGSNFNITLRILVSNHFDCLLRLLGDTCLSEIFRNFAVLYKDKKIYVQIIGRPLLNYFDKSKPTRQVQKGPERESPIVKLMNRNLDRNQFLYCLHSNRRCDFFHKSLLFQMKRDILIKKRRFADFSKTSDMVLEKLETLFVHIFGKEKINRKTRARLTPLIGRVLSNYINIDIESIFRKECSFNFKQYSAIKNTLSEVMQKIYSKDDRKGVPSDEGLRAYRALALQGRIAECFSQLTAMTVDENNVYMFIRRVFERLFPIELFGQKNAAVLYHFLKKMITMKRFESFSIADVYRKMDISKLTWFDRDFLVSFAKQIHCEKRDLLVKALVFVFDLMLSLVKSSFYVTEKHNEHNKIFFYSKSVWFLISQFGTLQLQIENLRCVSRPIPASVNERPCGKLRFVPKNDSVRPIMTFHRRFRDSKLNKAQKISVFLTPVKIVLRNIKYTLTEKFGFSVFDNHQIFSKLETFVESWRKRGSPQLYVATMDIKKCYDSVNLDKLFEFIQSEPVFQEMYLVNNFFKIIRNKRYYFHNENSAKKLTNLFYGKRRDTSNVFEELVDLSKYFKDKIVVDDKTIFIDSGVKYIMTKDEIVEKLRFACTNVFVKFGKSLFHLNRGLPQGLSVSSVLSSFYYACLESRATANTLRRLDKEKSLYLIMRLTDDYLIITDNKANTQEIVENLFACGEANNFEFNQKKLRANFPIPKFTTEKNPREFKWIGKTINLRDMFVEHVQILDKKEAFYTVNTNLPSERKLIGDFLKGKFKTFLLNQNSFYFNSRINSDAKIGELLPKIATSSFFKLNAYLNLLGPIMTRRPTIVSESHWISYKLIETIIDCSYLVAKSSTALSMDTVLRLILSKVIQLLQQDCNFKFKLYMLKKLKLFLKSSETYALKFVN